MTVYFNPLDLACKSVTGAIRQNEELQLNVYLRKKECKKDIRSTPILEDCATPTNNAYLEIMRDGEEPERHLMENTQFGWSITIKIKKTGLYFYTFNIEDNGYISCGYMQMGELGTQARSFHLTVYSADYQTPDWFKGGVMYQIFPDRFCKEGSMPDIEGRVRRTDWGGDPQFRPNKQGKILNNDFFGGNFKGIQSKLSYLKSLGVTVIYLNPIFEAASNHRYDTSDYMRIDPVLGTEKDFKDLVDEAKKMNIRIILDGVFNHTGDNSVYFNKYGKYPSLGAYQSKDSPYYGWYSFEAFPDKYASWWGIDILPEVNENSKEYQEFIFGQGGVLKNWLSYGIGGYRLDVADELPDFFLKELRKSVKESDQDAIIIGEVWEDASDKIAYSKRREYFQGRELDSVMNYPLKDGIINYMQTGNAQQLVHTIRLLIDHYPKQTVDCLMNILGTHDTARILTVLGGIYCNNKEEMSQPTAYLSPENKEKNIKKLKMAALLQYTLPGVPCLYYGDENGTEGHIDPFCRRCFDWNHLNEDLIEFYRKLGKIRKEYHEIFKDGNFHELHVEENLIFYKRENSKGEKIYIFANNGEKRYLIDLPNTFEELITNTIYQNDFEIKPNSYGILAAVK